MFLKPFRMPSRMLGHALYLFETTRISMKNVCHLFFQLFRAEIVFLLIKSFFSLRINHLITLYFVGNKAKG